MELFIILSTIAFVLMHYKRRAFKKDLERDL